MVPHLYDLASMALLNVFFLLFLLELLSCQVSMVSVAIDQDSSIYILDLMLG